MTEVSLNSTTFNVDIVTTDIVLEIGQRAVTEGGGGGGVSVHSDLTGLAEDDHAQYHNNARGDARYSQLGHTHTASEITDFSTAADARITLQKGAALGLAPLDSGSKIAAVYLPAYVDDVLEYADLAAFPGTGTTGTIYVTLDTNKSYRWSGSTYVEISPSPGSTDSVTEGSTNLYFTTVRAIASLLTGFTAGAGVVSAADSILQAIQKIVGNIAALVPYTGATTNVDLGAYKLTSTGLLSNARAEITNTTPLNDTTVGLNVVGGSGHLQRWYAGTSSPRMRLTNTGFLYVGTSDSVTPDSMLEAHAKNAGTTCLVLRGFGTYDTHYMRIKDSGGATIACFDYRGYYGFGTTTPSAPIHIIKTTEQQRLGYSESVYSTTTVSSTGVVTFDAEGANAGFTFNEKITNTLPLKMKSYTVATLPAGTEGDEAYVTDATSPTYLGALTGGGSVKCPVFYNGSVWVSH